MVYFLLANNLMACMVILLEGCSVIVIKNVFTLEYLKNTLSAIVFGSSNSRVGWVAYIFRPIRSIGTQTFASLITRIPGEDGFNLKYMPRGAKNVKKCISPLDGLELIFKNFLSFEIVVSRSKMVTLFYP